MKQSVQNCFGNNNVLEKEFIRVAMVREKYQENDKFPGQGRVREFYGWSGKFRKDLESQGKVREFKNKWLRQADFRKFIYSVQEGKRYTFS